MITVQEARFGIRSEGGGGGGGGGRCRAWPTSSAPSCPPPRQREPGRPDDRSPYAEADWGPGCLEDSVAVVTARSVGPPFIF